MARLNENESQESASELGSLRDFQDFLFAEERQMRATFKQLDSEGSRGVTAKELRAGLRRFGIELDKCAASRLVRRFDADNSGQLEFGEFVKMIQSDPDRG